MEHATGAKVPQIVHQRNLLIAPGFGAACVLAHARHCSALCPMLFSHTLPCCQKMGGRLGTRDSNPSAGGSMYDMSLLFGRVRACLETDPLQSLGGVASRVHVSPASVRRSIRANVDMAFRAFKGRLILEKVRQVTAANPSYSVRDVCFAIGYRSPKAFSRAVAKLAGAPPSGLRRSAMRGAQQVTRIAAPEADPSLSRRQRDEAHSQELRLRQGRSRPRV